MLFFSQICVSFAFSQAENSKEDELFFVAQKALEDGFYDVSLGYLDRFLKEFPQTKRLGEVYLLIGQCYLNKDKYLDAIQEFDKILELPQIDKIRDTISYWKAEVYFRAKDYPNAKTFYKEVITKYPNSKYIQDANYSLAWCLFEEGNYKEAIDGFTQLVRLYPQNEFIEDSYFKIGESYFNLKKYDDAKKSFALFVEKYSESKKIDQAYFYKAESNYYLENYQEAAEDYKKVIQISKDDKLQVLSKTALGWSYLMLKNFPEAEQAFKEAETMARQKSIGLDNVILGKASLLSESNKDQEALTVYDELINNFQDSSLLLNAYLGKANSLYKLAKYKEALEAYEELSNRLSWQEEFSDLLSKVYFGISWTNLKMGRMPEAVKSFQELINRTKDKLVRINALSQLGDLYQEMGEYQKAVDIYDSLLKDYQDSLYSDYAQYQLALTLLKMRNTDAAIIALQSLKINFPQSKFISNLGYYLGLAYFNKGDYQASQEQLQGFVDSISKDNELRPQAMQLLGLVYRELKKFKESANIFERITKEYSANKEVAGSAEYDLAVSFFYLGNEKEGLKRLKILSYNYPHTKVAEDSLYYTADYYLKTKEYETARRYFQKIVEEYPESDLADNAYYGIAESFFESGNSDEAIKNLEAIRSKPYSKLFVQASLYLANIYVEKENIDLAIKICRKLAETNPESARDVFIRIGDYFKAQSKFDDSLKAYETALTKTGGSSDFDDPDIYFKIAELYESKQDLDKATQTYLKVAYLSSSDSPLSVKAYLRAARIFENRESWKEARKIYEKIANENVEESKFARERIEWIDSNIKN